MLPQSPRSDLCWSPSLSRSSPESDAAILGRHSVDAWNETALRRRASLTEAETRVDKLPAYQGSSCSDACERGDRLVSLMEIDLSLARSMARRLTAAAYHTPGLRLDLVKGEWLKAHRRRPLQPRCRTFGCTLPDLHAGLHQVPPVSAFDPSLPRPQRPAPHARPSRRWLARCASGGWYPDAGLATWKWGARRWPPRSRGRRVRLERHEPEPNQS